MVESVFDDRVCALGEGPLWHPLRKQFFWFDILGKRLLSRIGRETFEWGFDEYVSAAGWVDHDRLMIASETALFLFDLASGEREGVLPLEADNPVTRSNDGRADPQGGLWIGTMGKAAEPKAGAIYRYFRGELRMLYPEITISNSICFSPEGDLAYFTDTLTQQIMRQRLDAKGWPVGEAEVHIDLRGDNRNPDGSVVDAQGRLWNAQWGSSRVACYDKDGAFLHAEVFEAGQTSCPAFGGENLSTLYVTSATQGMGTPGPADGLTFARTTEFAGQAEHQVIL